MEDFRLSPLALTRSSALFARLISHIHATSDFVAPGRATRARASTKRQETMLEFEEIRGPWATKGDQDEGKGDARQKDHAA